MISTFTNKSMHNLPIMNPQVYSIDWSVSSRRFLSLLANFFLANTSLHLSHPSHWSIMLMFLTCCSDGENLGKGFFLSFFGLVVCLLGVAWKEEAKSPYSIIDNMKVMFVYNKSSIAVYCFFFNNSSSISRCRV